MTPDFLNALVQANLAGGAAIAFVLAMRKPIRHAFGARVGYGLWSLAPLAAAATFLPARTVTVAAPSTIAAAPAMSLFQPMAELPQGPVETVAASFDPMMLAVWLWALGVAVMIGWLAVRQARFMKDLSRGEAGPAVVGFLRPRIVTPSDFTERFNPREQAVVLAHENIHLSRHDARINAVAALARCICWFNPLVHLGSHLMRIDQELACDAAVLQRHPKAGRSYAQALLKAQLAARPLPLGCYWPAGGEHPLTERIAMLKHANPGRARAIIGGLGVSLIAFGAGLAAWGAQPAQMILATAMAAPAAAAPVPAPAAVTNTPAPAPSPVAAVASVESQDKMAPPMDEKALGDARLAAWGEIPVRESEIPSPTQQKAFRELFALPAVPASSPREVADLVGEVRLADGSAAPFSLSSSPAAGRGSWISVVPDGAMRLEAGYEGGRAVIKARYSPSGQVVSADIPVAIGAPTTVSLPGGYQATVTAAYRRPTVDQLATTRYEQMWWQAFQTQRVTTCSTRFCDPEGWDREAAMAKARAEVTALTQ